MVKACYHPELEAGKHKAIFLTYGKALDTDKPALEIFDGGIGMSGMDSSSGEIAAWAALVSFLQHSLFFFVFFFFVLEWQLLSWFGSTDSMSHSDAMQKAPQVRSAHQRQSGNQHCLYAQAHALCSVQGCSVRKGKSKQDDPPPFLTAQLGRYKDCLSSMLPVAVKH